VKRGNVEVPGFFASVTVNSKCEKRWPKSLSKASMMFRLIFSWYLGVGGERRGLDLHFWVPFERTPRMYFFAFRFFTTASDSGKS